MLKIRANRSTNKAIEAESGTCDKRKWRTLKLRTEQLNDRECVRVHMCMCVCTRARESFVYDYIATVFIFSVRMR